MGDAKPPRDVRGGGAHVPFRKHASRERASIDGTDGEQGDTRASWVITSGSLRAILSSNSGKDEDAVEARSDRRGRGIDLRGGWTGTEHIRAKGVPFGIS
jgi:hypothetical protein